MKLVEVVVIIIMATIAFKLSETMAEGENGEIEKAKYGEYCADNVLCDDSNVLAEYECIKNTCHCPTHPNAMPGLTYQYFPDDWEGCFLVVGSKCNGVNDEPSNDGNCVKDADCKSGVCVCQPGKKCVSKVIPPPLKSRPKNIPPPEKDDAEVLMSITEVGDNDNKKVKGKKPMDKSTRMGVLTAFNSGGLGALRSDHDGRKKGPNKNKPEEKVHAPQEGFEAVALVENPYPYDLDGIPISRADSIRKHGIVSCFIETICIGLLVKICMIFFRV